MPVYTEYNPYRLDRVGAGQGFTSWNRLCPLAVEER